MNIKTQKLYKNSKILQNFSKIKKFLQKNIIYFHPLYLLLFVFFYLTNNLKFFICYTLVVLLHETAHFIVAKKLGYVCHKIKLMPYGAVLDAETDDFSFYDEIKIAIAGPLCNLFLCLITICLWWLWPVSFNYTEDFMLSNLVIGLFNLVPIFPLDGGRILLAVLTQKTGRASGVKMLKAITAIFGLALFIVFIASLFFKPNISIGTMGLMMFWSALCGDKQTRFERVSYLSKKIKKLNRGLFVKTIVIIAIIINSIILFLLKNI